ncbi:MAG: hypothetical protein Q6K70_05105 [Thermostichales cyanobacterium DRC_bins_46]
MPLTTSTLDYRLYVMALLLEEYFQPGKLQGIRTKAGSQEQTYRL